MAKRGITKIESTASSSAIGTDSLGRTNTPRNRRPKPGRPLVFGSLGARGSETLRATYKPRRLKKRRPTPKDAARFICACLRTGKTAKEIRAEVTKTCGKVAKDFEQAEQIALAEAATLAIVAEDAIGAIVTETDYWDQVGKFYASFILLLVGGGLFAGGLRVIKTLANGRKVVEMSESSLLAIRAAGKIVGKPRRRACRR